MELDNLDLSELNEQLGNNIIGEITIDFYGKDQASVNVKLQDGLTESDLLQFFNMYLTRVFFNLGKGDVSDSLIICINGSMKLLSESLNENSFQRYIILPKGKELVSKKTGAIKTYIAEIYQRSNGRFVETKCIIGEEEYYGPMSVLMFLQYLMDELSYSGFIHLLLSTRFIFEYYEQVGDYSASHSIIDAVTYAQKKTNNFLNNCEVEE